MKHRKQEIAGLAFFLFALVSVLIYANFIKADTEQDYQAALSAQSTCNNWQVTALTNWNGNSSYRSDLITAKDNAHTRFNNLKSTMTAADQQAVQSYLDQADSSFNGGETKYNLGITYYMSTANPIGGQQWKIYAGSDLDSGHWALAKTEYDCGTGQFQNSNVSFNYARQYYVASNSGVMDANDVMDHYGP